MYSITSELKEVYESITERNKNTNKSAIIDKLTTIKDNNSNRNIYSYNDHCVTSSCPIPSSDSGDDSEIEFVNNAVCTSLHEGHQYVNTILPVNTDLLFQTLFTHSKFIREFQRIRNVTAMIDGKWKVSENGKETRTITCDFGLKATIGPKVSHVTEIQEIMECSVPGHLLAVNIISWNEGIPYADVFELLIHHCLYSMAENRTKYSVFIQVHYKKSVWSVMKTIIDRNTHTGLEEHYNSLAECLHKEFLILPPPIKTHQKDSRRRKIKNDYYINSDNVIPTMSDAIPHLQCINNVSTDHQNTELNKSSHISIKLSSILFCMLALLAIVNCVLYYYTIGY